MKQVHVSEWVFDVRREVSDLSAAAWALEMIVHPTYEDLFWSEHHEIVQCFAFFEQRNELFVMDEVDTSQQTNLHVTSQRTVHWLTDDTVCISRYHM